MTRNQRKAVELAAAITAAGGAGSGPYSILDDAG